MERADRPKSIVAGGEREQENLDGKHRVRDSGDEKQAKMAADTRDSWPEPG